MSSFIPSDSSVLNCCKYNIFLNTKIHINTLNYKLPIFDPFRREQEYRLSIVSFFVSNQDMAYNLLQY